MPGEYTATLEKWVDGALSPLLGPERFMTEILGTASLPEPDRKEALAFQQKVARLQRAVMGAVRASSEVKTRFKEIKKALFNTPSADPSLSDRARVLEQRLLDLEIALNGDSLKRSLDEAILPAISRRVRRIVGTQWSSTCAITNTSRDNYAIAGKVFTSVLDRLRTLIEQDLKQLEDDMEAAGAPWTPGRLPRWEME